MRSKTPPTWDFSLYQPPLRYHRYHLTLINLIGYAKSRVGVARRSRGGRGLDKTNRRGFLRAIPPGSGLETRVSRAGRQDPPNLADSDANSRDQSRRHADAPIRTRSAAMTTYISRSCQNRADQQHCAVRKIVRCDSRPPLSPGRPANASHSSDYDARRPHRKIGGYPNRCFVQNGGDVSEMLKSFRVSGHPDLTARAGGLDFRFCGNDKTLKDLILNDATNRRAFSGFDAKAPRRIRARWPLYRG